MSEQVFLVAKARRTNASLTNEQLEHRLKTAGPATRILGVGAHFNPLAGGASDIIGSERAFRVQRGAKYSEARQMQNRSQRGQAGALVATGGGILAGEAIRNPRNLNKPKLKELARNKKVLGGTAALVAGTGYSKIQGRRKGKIEDKVWNRLVTTKPRSRGL